MSAPRIFKVPVLQVRGMPPPSRAPAVPGLHPRLQPGRYRGFGSAPPPLPNGAPGNPQYPYDERGLWGDGGSGSGSMVSVPPPTTQSGTALDAVQQGMVSVPFGESARDWNNPTTYATVPLLGSLTATSGQTSVLPLLSLNLKRNSLIIQNQSSATAAGDVAPTLYVGFNVQAVVGQSLALPPGLGFYWGASDCPPRDSIYVALGSFVNTGNSVIIAGCVVQGTYVQNGAPYQPNVTAKPFVLGS